MTEIGEPATRVSSDVGAAARFGRVAGAIRAVFAATDAEVVTPPVLQSAAPYFDLSGEDIRGRLLLVDDPGEVTYCLRPDFTIPVCRLYLQRRPSAAAAYRYEGAVFRAEPGTGGPPSEAPQFGLERFGDPDPEAAELAVFALALEAVRAGGGRVVRVMLGDANLFAAFVDGLGLADADSARLKRAYARPQRPGSAALGADLSAASTKDTRRGNALLATALAGLPPGEAEAALREVYRLAGIEPVGGRPLAAVIDRLRQKAERREDPVVERATAAARAFAVIAGPPETALETARAHARAHGVDIDGPLEAWFRRITALSDFDVAGSSQFSVGFARQFDYYDGMVFEIHDPAVGARPVLAGGGRYDSLTTRLGAAEAVSAVGCMARPDRVAASAHAASALAPGAAT